MIKNPRKNCGNEGKINEFEIFLVNGSLEAKEVQRENSKKGVIDKNKKRTTKIEILPLIRLGLHFPSYRWAVDVSAILMTKNRQFFIFPFPRQTQRVLQ